jgi:hypothetical protein
MKNSQPLHPLKEELIALTIDELPQERADEIRRHLTECPDCLEQMRLLLRLPDEPPVPELEIGDAEQAQAWRQFSAKLAAEGERADSAPPLKAIPFRAPARPSPLWLPLAAILAVAIGLAIGRWGLGGPRSEAIGSVATTSLTSSSFYHRGAVGTPQKANCPAPGGAFVFVLAPDFSDGPKPATVFLELLPSSGQKIADGKFPVSPRGEVELLITRSLLPNGQYLMKLRTEEKGNSTEELAISVDCP